MRILVHDFGGYPFPAQLSRELAAMGHYVRHTFPSGLPGPKGNLETSAADSDRLTVRSIPLSQGFRKYSPARRLISQRRYARDLTAFLAEENTDVVLSANTPIDVQGELLWYCRRNHIGFVHWVQDVYCAAIEFFFHRRLGALATPISYPFRLLEKAVAQGSDTTVVIAPAFKALMTNWGIAADNIEVVENWAPLPETPTHPRRNAWAAAQGLENHTVLLYSGTLGFKHRPGLLYNLAKSVGPECKVVVISEGFGRDYLAKLPPLENLILLGFQPYEQLPQVLASADVLLATLEADAGHFAVPSKILTYLCAGRPILVAAPRTNLAASVIERSGGGLVVDSNDEAAWVNAGKRLSRDHQLRAELARNARAYAEKRFEIRQIADSFERILIKAGRPYNIAPSIMAVHSDLQS